MTVQGEPAYIGALLEPAGHALFRCAEMEFGTALAEHPTLVDADGNPLSHTNLDWVVDQRSTAAMIMQVSLDDGRTWLPQPKNKPIVGTAAGDVLNGKHLRLRQLFFGSANVAPILRSITWTMTFTDGAVLTRTETGDTGDDALTLGRFEGVQYFNFGLGGEGVSKSEQVVADYTSATTANRDHLTNIDTAYVKGEKLELSYGKTISLAPALDLTYDVPLDQGPLPPPPWHPGDPFPDGWITATAHERDNATSWAVEFWMKPSEITAQTLVRWRKKVWPGDERPGTKIMLDSDGSIVLQAIEFTFTPGDGELGAVVRTLRTSPDVVSTTHWTHVAITHDGVFADIRIDGQVKVTARMVYSVDSYRGSALESLGFISPMDGQFFVGGGDDQLAQPVGQLASGVYTGLLSELRLYRRAARASISARRNRRLRTDEIAMMETEEATVLAAYYQLETGLEDSTSHGNDLRAGSGSLAKLLSTDLTWLEIRPGGPSSLPAGIRTSPPKSLDTQGNTVRLSDAPFDFEFGSMTFLGIGHLGRMSVIQDKAALVPATLELELNGLVPALVSLAIRSAYLDRPCRAWAVLFDRLGVMVQRPQQLFEGRVDSMDIAISESAAIRVTATSHLMDWERPSGLVWNYTQQRDLYPNDHGFEHMAAVVEAEIWWPANLNSLPSTGP